MALQSLPEVQWSSILAMGPSVLDTDAGVPAVEMRYTGAELQQPVTLCAVLCPLHRLVESWPPWMAAATSLEHLGSRLV